MGERSSIRVKKPYVRQTTRRLEWDQRLSAAFEKAVIKLGGAAKAKARAITMILQDTFPFITLPHVSSHLQKYREKRGIAIRSKKSRESSEDETSRSTSSKRRVLKNVYAAKQLVVEVQNTEQSSSSSDMEDQQDQSEENKMIDVVYALMTLEYCCGINELNYSKPNEPTYSVHVQCK
uniref:Uncharacterized protein n=1 Tax=Clandestinovirus TaxID=2831644 RepID=A0A8F8PMI4_9VIRU|nr:hypothetical protein KOM_12_291 [Clandestinovirus]